MNEPCPISIWNDPRHSPFSGNFRFKVRRQKNRLQHTAGNNIRESLHSPWLSVNIADKMLWTEVSNFATRRVAYMQSPRVFLHVCPRKRKESLSSRSCRQSVQSHTSAASLRFQVTIEYATWAWWCPYVLSCSMICALWCSEQSRRWEIKPRMPSLILVLEWHANLLVIKSYAVVGWDRNMTKVVLSGGRASYRRIRSSYCQLKISLVIRCHR